MYQFYNLLMDEFPFLFILFELLLINIIPVKLLFFFFNLEAHTFLLSLKRYPFLYQ